jgi:hypothetical protein
MHNKKTHVAQCQTNNVKRTRSGSERVNFLVSPPPPFLSRPPPFFHVLLFEYYGLASLCTTICILLNSLHKADRINYSLQSSRKKKGVGRWTDSMTKYGVEKIIMKQYRQARRMDELLWSFYQDVGKTRKGKFKIRTYRSRCRTRRAKVR